MINKSKFTAYLLINYNTIYIMTYHKYTQDITKYYSIV